MGPSVTKSLGYSKRWNQNQYQKMIGIEVIPQKTFLYRIPLHPGFNGTECGEQVSDKEPKLCHLKHQLSSLALLLRAGVSLTAAVLGAESADNVIDIFPSAIHMNIAAVRQLIDFKIFLVEA